MLSCEAAHQAKKLGLENDLIECAKTDLYFTLIKGGLYTFLEPKSFVGRTPEQVEKFTEEWVKPTLDSDESRSGIEDGVKIELSFRRAARAEITSEDGAGNV